MPALKHFRVRAGFKQVQAAAFLNVSPAYLSGVESGAEALSEEKLKSLLSYYSITEKHFQKSIGATQVAERVSAKFKLELLLKSMSGPFVKKTDGLFLNSHLRSFWDSN
ncbi:MAG: helix-turn-helix domain-containing protein [Bdellovibrionales bacterium]|nr:helix-turn-helix domain-containing protein [Bdellovibrionales bacterium]